MHHSKSFVLNNIFSSKVYEYIEDCLKFSIIPIIYPRTNNISLPYHLFWSKIEALNIEVLPINTNDQLKDEFAKGLQEGKYERTQNYFMKWYIMKWGQSLYCDVHSWHHGSYQ